MSFRTVPPRVILVAAGAGRNQFGFGDGVEENTSFGKKVVDTHRGPVRMGSALLPAQCDVIGVISLLWVFGRSR